MLRSIILLSLPRNWWSTGIVHKITCHSKCCITSQHINFAQRFSSDMRSVPTVTNVKNYRQTIYALSSAHGKAGVAVVRISGPHAAETLLNLSTRKKLPIERHATLCSLYCPEDQTLLDQALVIWFHGPNSFTGENVCELHLHGGIATVNAVLTALSNLNKFGLDIRHAEPGEFTRRSFENGCLDLTEVEGLSDLISAETEAQRRQAVLQLTGALSKLYIEWTRQITKNVAAIEAYIDFSEDDNIEDDIIEQVAVGVKELRDDIVDHLSDARRGERIRNGLSVVIAGNTNVGKSSLLNHLCQRPAAIVSPLPGTTRDIVETFINLAGYPIRVCDTAGLRNTQDIVELEGINRARERLFLSDLRIIMLDASLIFTKYSTLTSQEMKEFILKEVNTLLYEDQMNHLGHSNRQYDQSNIDSESRQYPGNVLIVLNKTDLLSENEINMLSMVCDFINKGDSTVSCCTSSCITDGGMVQCVEALAVRVKLMCGDTVINSPVLTQTRHRQHLSAAIDAMNTFLELLSTHITVQLGTAAPPCTAPSTPPSDHDNDLVIVSSHLRMALREIGKVTGRVTSEDVLDVIFKEFCIGK